MFILINNEDLQYSFALAQPPRSVSTFLLLKVAIKLSRRQTGFNLQSNRTVSEFLVNLLDLIQVCPFVLTRTSANDWIESLSRIDLCGTVMKIKKIEKIDGGKRKRGKLSNSKCFFSILGLVSFTTTNQGNSCEEAGAHMSLSVTSILRTHAVRVADRMPEGSLSPSFFHILSTLVSCFRWYFIKSRRSILPRLWNRFVATNSVERECAGVNSLCKVQLQYYSRKCPSLESTSMSILNPDMRSEIENVRYWRNVLYDLIERFVVAKV